MLPPDPVADFEIFANFFRECGGTDERYLRAHFPRYLATRDRFLDSRERVSGKLLDVGAHWLHQSLMYALSGFSVTALDMPTTFADTHVTALADRYRIVLLPEPDLADPASLRRVAENSFDVVLFTEVIEHLAFNPVALWKEIHRVMKPGARLIVTTPNYYALRGRAWQWLRFLSGGGAGVRIEALMSQPTFAHHWKEFSLAELQRYFSALSRDFHVVSAQRVEKYGRSERHYVLDGSARLIERCVPALRPELYLELQLTKDHGIAIEPHW